MGCRDIVRVLVDRGLVSESDVQGLLTGPSSGRASMERLLVERGLVAEADMIALMSEIYALEITALADEDVKPEAATLLPREVIERLEVFPMRVTEGELLLAMVDPLDITAEDQVRLRTGLNVKRCVVSRRDLARAIKDWFGQRELVDVLLDKMPDDEAVEFLFRQVDDTEAEIDRGDAPPIVKLVSAILVDAVKMRASDVHVQPTQEGLQVRYRIDGLLKDVVLLPKSLSRSVVSRLKVISDMDISETRRPQDGRSYIRVAGQVVDLRVNSLPGLYGEKVVFRILERGRGLRDLEEVGMQPQDVQIFSRFIRSPHGLLLITGPTGSGKTSTLYGAVKKIHNPTESIVTVEDPIEYQLDGIHQVQVNERAGITFASALRAILRQDPNVILVGEIRDLETAQIAVQAAMTGHLVLSTLHTNDAPATLNRLIYMGVELFPLASTLLGVVSQRLVRRICTKCRTPVEPPEALIRDLQAMAPGFRPSACFQGRGCEECHYTGYKGRLGLFEILGMSSALRDLVCRGASEPDLVRQARREGMRRLIEDGLDKCNSGETTFEEVLRVAPGQGLASEEPAPEPATLPPFVSAPGFGRSLQSAPSGEAPEKVLVVDDEAVVRKLLRVALKSAGYEVAEARNGEQGLKAVWTERPDLIICDVKMPQMDGFEFTRRLRQSVSTSLIPIILLTSSGDGESESTGRAAGADEYLTKPVELAELLRRVSSLLRARHQPSDAGLLAGMAGRQN